MLRGFGESPQALQATQARPQSPLLSASGLQGSRCSHPQVCEVCGCISPGQHGRGKTGRLFYCTQCWNQCNVHSVPKARPSKQPPQRSCRRHFEVRNALTGEVIDVHPCCTRIYDKLSWPAKGLPRGLPPMCASWLDRRSLNTHIEFVMQLKPSWRISTLQQRC